MRVTNSLVILLGRKIENNHGEAAWLETKGGRPDPHKASPGGPVWGKNQDLGLQTPSLLHRPTSFLRWLNSRRGSRPLQREALGSCPSLTTSHRRTQMQVSIQTFWDCISFESQRHGCPWGDKAGLTLPHNPGTCHGSGLSNDCPKSHFQSNLNQFH